MNLKSILKNWKTSTVGIALIATSIYTFTQNTLSFELMVGGVLGGIGFLLSNDSTPTE